MNKKQCEKLIDKLSDKTLSFGCEIILNPQSNKIGAPPKEKEICTN